MMCLEQRVAALPWSQLERSLDEYGWARTPVLLNQNECERLIASYTEPNAFRSRIDMTRYRFGQGEYQYFDYPLPDVVAGLRRLVYPHLASVANRWMEQLGNKQRYPSELSALTAECQSAGQTKATPLVLHYEAGGYNCLHQDLYGEIAFPLQVVIALNQKSRDYTGGEFVLVEQRPRAQSAAHVIAPAQGEGVIFTTRYRPARGKTGYYRVNVKHGVSRVESGTRWSLGIIFHDAK